MHSVNQVFGKLVYFVMELILQVNLTITVQKLLFSDNLKFIQTQMLLLLALLLLLLILLLVLLLPLSKPPQIQW